MSSGSEIFQADEEDIPYDKSTRNYTPPLPSPSQNMYYFAHERYVDIEDVEKQVLDKMPGFRFTWYYSGIEIEPVAKYAHEDITKAFVRKGSILYAYDMTSFTQFYFFAFNNLRIFNNHKNIKPHNLWSEYITESPLPLDLLTYFVLLRKEIYGVL